MKSNKLNDVERKYRIYSFMLLAFFMGILLIGILTQSNNLDYNFLLVPLFLLIIAAFCFLISHFAIKKDYVSADVFTANLLFFIIALFTPIILYLKRRVNKSHKTSQIENKDIGDLFFILGVFFLLLDLLLLYLNLNYVIFGIKRLWIHSLYFR